MPRTTQGFDLDTAPDLGAIEDEAIVVHLNDALDEPMFYEDEAGAAKPVTWRVKGTYSSTFQDVIRAQKKRIGKRMRAGADFVDATEDNDVEAIVACSDGWDGFFAKGAPLPFSKANATAVLSAPKAQHLKAQLERAMGHHERFFKRA